MNRYLLLASAALVLAACNKTGVSSAPASDTAAVSSTTDPVALAGTPPDADPAAAPAAIFVEKAADTDAFEIAAAKIVLAKTKNNDVKGFAKMMVDDHTKSTDALKQAIKDSGRTDLDIPETLSLEKAAMIDDLNKSPDTLLDAMYLTQQVTVHADGEKLMSAYALAGDTPQLKDFAGKTAPVVQSHLDKAHQLQTKLAG